LQRFGASLAADFVEANQRDPADHQHTSDELHCLQALAEEQPREEYGEEP
jgi:hypothetical protein